MHIIPVANLHHVDGTPAAPPFRCCGGVLGTTNQVSVRMRVTTPHLRARVPAYVSGS